MKDTPSYFLGCPILSQEWTPLTPAPYFESLLLRYSLPYLKQFMVIEILMDFFTFERFLLSSCSLCVFLCCFSSICIQMYLKPLSVHAANPWWYYFKPLTSVWQIQWWTPFLYALLLHSIWGVQHCIYIAWLKKFRARDIKEVIQPHTALVWSLAVLLLAVFFHL